MSKCSRFNMIAPDPLHIELASMIMYVGVAMVSQEQLIETGARHNHGRYRNISTLSVLCKISCSHGHPAVQSRQDQVNLKVYPAFLDEESGQIYVKFT